MNFPSRQKFLVSAYSKTHRATINHTLESKSVATPIRVKLQLWDVPRRLQPSVLAATTFSMTRRIVLTFSIGNPISMHQRLCLFGVLVVKVISFIWGFGLVILLGLRLHRNAAASSPCNSTSMSWQWSNRLILLVLNLVVRSILTMSFLCNTELMYKG